MRFIKDTEKEQLKRLVKACMLEISKLKMDLKKCREHNNNVPDVQQSNSEIEISSDRIEELEISLKEKDKTILELKQSLKSQDNRINDLEEIKTYFEALTAKPKRDLTSFQSQVYMLLPSEKANTEKMHNIIKKIGFKELSIDNMFHILRNLERKGYFSSERVNDVIIWKKIEK